MKNGGGEAFAFVSAASTDVEENPPIATARAAADTLMVVFLSR